MIYDDKLYHLEDTVDLVAKTILETDLISDYCHQYSLIKKDETINHIVADFLEKKEAFERVEQYGSYAPDFKEKRRALRKAKRVLDTNEEIAEFKYNETSLQNVLDYMCLDIAQVISDTIKVDAGNPFFEFAKRGCGGNCHVK